MRNLVVSFFLSYFVGARYFSYEEKYLFDITPFFLCYKIKRRIKPKNKFDTPLLR